MKTKAAGKDCPNQKKTGKSAGSSQRSAGSDPSSCVPYSINPGKALADFRGRFGLTKTRASQLLGCTDQHIYNIENGIYHANKQFSQAVFDLIRIQDPSAVFGKRKKNLNVEHSTSNAQRSTPEQEAPTCSDCKQFQPSDDEFGHCSVGCYHKKRKATAPMCGMFEAKSENPANVEHSTSNVQLPTKKEMDSRLRGNDNAGCSTDPGEAIKQYRTQYLLSQNQVGQMLGCLGSSIGNIENGRVEASADLAARIFELIKKGPPSIESAAKAEKYQDAMTLQIRSAIDGCVAMRSDLYRACEILNARQITSELAGTANSLAYKTFVRARAFLEQIERMVKNKPGIYPANVISAEQLRNSLRETCIFLINCRTLSDKVQAVVCEWLEQGLREKLQSMSTKEVEVEND